LMNKLMNKGLWFIVVDLGDTHATNNVCFTRKTRTQQNSNPNESDNG
jgi:hypothetical protein